jgi:4,5-dihydroxyphthalate decarboxylase
MANLRLTLACGPYDRTHVLSDGSIRPDGVELNYITLQPAEIFWRMLQYTHEQGLSGRVLSVEELFAPSTLRDIPLTEGQRV